MYLTFEYRFFNDSETVMESVVQIVIEGNDKVLINL